MRQAACGDRRAFDTLCLRHLPRLFAVAMRVSGDPAVAEEVAQETFLRAWRQRDRFDPARGLLAGWLNRIALNLAIDHKRAARASVPLPDDWPAETADPVASLSHRATRSALAHGLAALPARQRAAVVLTYLHERSGRDAARALGVSPRALEGLLRRARMFLKEWLVARGV